MTFKMRKLRAVSKDDYLRTYPSIRGIVENDMLKRILRHFQLRKRATKRCFERRIWVE